MFPIIYKINSILHSLQKWLLFFNFLPLIFDPSRVFEYYERRPEKAGLGV